MNWSWHESFSMSGGGAGTDEVKPITEFIVLDQYMANKSEFPGVKVFYLTYQGKIDTPGLDMNRVPVTPTNGGNSTAVVAFDGCLRQSVPGNSIDAPDYFVLKWR